jgi:hypothetical protein
MKSHLFPLCAWAVPNYAMRRTDLQGTDLRVHKQKLLRSRQMTPEERLRKTEELIIGLREMRLRIARNEGKKA